MADFTIHGTLTKVHATVDTDSYKLIHGLLAYNFGEPLPFPPPGPPPTSIYQPPPPTKQVTS